MNRIEAKIRPNIARLVAYKSARDEFDGEASVYLDANENPYGLFNRYPDPNQTALKEKIASIKGCELDQLFLGNGSDECIDLLFRIFCTPGRDRCLTFTPTYGMYEVSAAINDVEVARLPLTDQFQIDRAGCQPYLNDPKVKVVFICTPNNPTGNSINNNDIEYLLENYEGIVVIDEAYIDFCSEESWSKLLDSYANLVVLQTLSKAYAMANLRIGLAIANRDIIQVLNKVKPPYNLSGLVQQQAIKQLEDVDKFKAEVEAIIKERGRLSSALQKLPNVIRVYPTEANFILVSMTEADSIYNKLKEKSTIVRSRTSVIKDGLRITVGTPKENTILLQQLKELTE